MADTFHINWYATGLRAERLEAALADITQTSLRYGATAWSVHRSQDDQYKFLQIVHFSEKISFERWWEGSEMVEFRTITSGWWQVPVLYSPQKLVGHGSISSANGNGAVAAEQASAA
ncbi:unannotated protein [freshwater metagenome]|uniref:Unannotated protein n=1 Tax=freshwater metagenome TaxID=449393 RepID=A0A6J7CXM4_9ZZZZ|nr:hypothetical protein [Actinomycetota bacterium]